MSYRGRGSGNSGFYNNNNSHNAMEIENQNNHSSNRSGILNHHQQQQQVSNFMEQNSVEVEIRGWENASKEDLLSFISRRCKTTIMNSVVDGSVIRGSVRDKKEAQTLSQWSGVRFAGNALKISVLSSNLGGSADSAANTIDILRTFLKIRYKPDLKLLNLSAVHSDPVLLSKGLFGAVSTSSKMFPALMKVAAGQNYDVETVDLSSNNLTDITGISTMAQTFPKLKNLSLQNNNITRLKALENWKHKFVHLRELVLLDNPIVNESLLKTEMLRIFPRLIILNGEFLRDEAKLNEILKFPVTTKQVFFEDSEIQSISTNFITNYLNFWDTNRKDLMSLYTQESQVSIQVDPSHPHISTAENPSPVDHPWGNYLTNSRNLTKLSTPKSRMSKICKGPEDIFKLFQSIPKTKHNLMENPTGFAIESWRYPQVNGIVIVLHGEFKEVAAPELTQLPSGPSANRSTGRRPITRPPLTKKSFDRTFVVVQGNAGSMIIASDMLTVKLYVEADAWAEKSVDLQTPVTTSQAVANQNYVAPPSSAASSVNAAYDLPPEIKASIGELQQQILLRVLQETKLNLEFAGILCEQSNWDYNTCIINFKSSVSSIPPHAYQQ